MALVNTARPATSRTRLQGGPDVGGAPVPQSRVALLSPQRAVWLPLALAVGLAAFGFLDLARQHALLLWSLLASIALLYGAAIAAQLESVRAGEPEPQDEHKVEHSEPELEPVAVGH